MNQNRQTKFLNRISKLSVLLMTIAYFAFDDVTWLKNLATMFFLLMSVVSAGSFVLKRKTAVAIYLTWGLIWIAICYLSTLWSVKPKSTLQYSGMTLQCILIGIGYVLMDSKLDIRNFLLFAVTAAGVTLMVRLAILTPSNDWGAERLGANIGIHVNGIAGSLLISELCAMMRYMETRRRLYLLSVIAMLVFIFLCASRKALVMGTIVPVLIYMLYVHAEGKANVKRLARYFLGALGVIIIAVIIMRTPLIYNIAQERMEGFINSITGKGEVDASTLERQELGRAAMNVFYEHPVYGVGLNGFRFASRAYYRGRQLYAHNNYKELLADLGVIGTTIYYYIYAVIVFINIRLFRKNLEAKILLLLAVMMLILDNGWVSYMLSDVQLLLVFVLSRTVRIRNELQGIETTGGME